MDLPDECNQWLTDEIRELLRAIRGAHAAKKRRTVIKLAFARANEQPLAQVFSQEDVCSETIWYQKWRHRPEIRAAYEACYQRALNWADEQTTQIEAHYRRQRRQSIAEYAAVAPAALANVMSESEQRGADRISAADTLMRWAEPETASKLQPTPGALGGGDQVVNVLAGLSNDQLLQLLELEDDADEYPAAGHEGATAGSPAAGAADASGE